MRRTSILIGTLLGLSWVGSGQAWAQTQPPQTDLSSPKTTVNAVVLRVDDRIAPFQHIPHNLFLTLRTEAGQVLSTYVGPSWYLTNRSFSFLPGDIVQVTGESTMNIVGNPIIDADRIQKGEAVLSLHDATGHHAWYSLQQR